MVANKVGRVIWERLRRIMRSHTLTHRVALNANKIYKHLKIRREFHSRISQINANEYLNISQKPNLNVIIIVVDSLRNSHLSSQGYFRETTPFLDSIKSRFTAISASAWTYPSVASILTGLYPHNHNAIISGEIVKRIKIENLKKLRSGILTLPEMLYLLGYGIYFSSAIGLASYSIRGRVVGKEYDTHARADQLLDDLTKWIAKKHRKPFFAYIHLADLHIPLNPPDNFENFFGAVKNLPNITTYDFLTAQQRDNDSEKFRDYKENRVLLYDNMIRYVDHSIENFHNSLKDMGLADSTIFMVTADHGEAFWEHAELQAGNFYTQGDVSGVGHGQVVFREVIEVPLLLSGPVPEKKDKGWVSTVDIVPTVIHMLGISHKMRFDGFNIFETDGKRPLLSEASGSGYEKKALSIGKYKLIYSKDDGIEWVFDLENDPHEQNPIVDKEVTSVFVDKLIQMLREDEKRKIKEITRKKNL